MRTIEQFAYTGNQIALDIAATEKQTLEVAGVELTAEPIDGVATFFLDGLLRTLYSDKRTLIAGCNYHYVDNAISLRATIAGKEQVFVRGVAQAGMQRKATQWKFLTTKSSLRWYRGYELGVVFCVENPDGLDWDVVNGGREIEQNYQYHDRITREIVFTDLSEPPFSTGWEKDLGISFDGVITDKIQLYQRPVPYHPFYVRWINELGGYDYHMFSCAQQHTIELSSQSTYDLLDGDGEQEMLEKNCAYSVEVSSGMVSEADAKAIAKLILSPDIRWYSEQANKWVRIIASQQAVTMQTGQPTSEVILKFVLPYKTNA